MSDPPRILDMDLARRQLAALGDLPRPTLVTCRTGARSWRWSTCTRGSFRRVVWQVLARAESDGAPFVRRAECRVWVEQGLRELSEAAAGARERIESKRIRRHRATMRLAGHWTGAASNRFMVHVAMHRVRQPGRLEGNVDE